MRAMQPGDDRSGARPGNEGLAGCANEDRDGRSHAAETAWQLLALVGRKWIRQIADNVAKAMAAKIVTEGAARLRRRPRRSLSTSGLWSSNC